jgi:tryptophan synthase alpha chain
VAPSDAAASSRSPLERVFDHGHRALICYFPLGDPLAPPELAHLYAQAGVDVLEIGVPGGNPALDGPVIADSLGRAAASGMTAVRAASLIASLRSEHPALGAVWFTYPRKRPTQLVPAVVASGVDALLLPEPARRHERIALRLQERQIPLVHFLAHDPPLRDVESALQAARGFVMLQANPGLTGAKPSRLPDSQAVISLLRDLGLTVPVALGIGISTPEQARKAIAMGADGVVVGSAVVQAMQRGRSSVSKLLHRLRKALDEA